jgi:hypothetical protein
MVPLLSRWTVADEQVFDREIAAKHYIILAAEHGAVNCDASFLAHILLHAAARRFRRKTWDWWGRPPHATNSRLGAAAEVMLM